MDDRGTFTPQAFFTEKGPGVVGIEDMAGVPMGDIRVFKDLEIGKERWKIRPLSEYDTGFFNGIEPLVSLEAAKRLAEAWLIEIFEMDGETYMRARSRQRGYMMMKQSRQ